MKLSNSKFTYLSALTLFVGTLSSPAQDHGHLRIAAYSTNQGAQLYFYNGPDFASSTRYEKPLKYTNAGKYSGYYQKNIPQTVQAAPSAYGGPEPAAPAFGSYIRARILSV